MDSLKLPKGNSATSSASGSNSNLSGSTSASASAATSPTSSGNNAAGGILTGAPKSPPGLSSSTPITVRFNANEESLDDILQSFHHSKHSPSGGASGGNGGDASPTSNLLGMKNNGLGLNTGLVVGACDSLSSSPSQPQMQGGSASLFGNDEVTLRNNFLQGGGFFNRKSSSAAPSGQMGGGYVEGLLGGGGGGSPYNGSQAGCSSGGISPIPPQMSGVSPKYRRSISFPIKGNSPTALYGNPHMDGLGSGGHMNIPTLSIGNGAGGGGSGGMISAGASGGGDAPYMGNNYGNMMSANGQMHHGGMDNSLSDYMRGMSLGGGNGGGGNGGGDGGNSMALMQDRMRVMGGPKHLSEADAMAIAASGNDPSVYLNALKMGSPSRLSPHSPHSPIQGGNGGNVGDGTARFSRKVFVGGLPPDIDEDEITTSFRRFGPLVVDWPHKAESKSYFPPKGYAFLLFQDESSVQQLIDSCITDEDKLYLCVSSPTIKDKAVQIRPWRLADADYVLDATMSLDPRKTVFVGGVPRPLKAFELAMIMDRLYGGVCYAGIDTDPELKYPKGAGRVAFSNQQSYIAAISARFVQLQHGDIDKRVEVKPYVLDDQMCDECEGQRCGGKFAPFFCANVTCLQYYCEHCWAVIHSRPGREYHKPLVKEGADRPRAVPFRWC
ncbi:hypothetical protein M5D96_006332 [Drosophila gunungcola]|uniref:RRM domain-containing protein n=1 Tax=Drosophila gunungcola TaxID=103775 RepID=A0A9P9YNY5_9MUSC|nr:hypothetical protein M5D96_006332 [Drosophila gunungcola]